ncbi:MAG TPA: histidine kinase [Dyella sp.]|uniref:sensor histidine kinase n=1 Tax=Dyella sp. TaxID=1869338 RepID=UPI002C05F8B5|nr:histidine kinase [Dyella sp.]HTV85434.1 histidine kinase [Dyella sp.]
MRKPAPTLWTDDTGALGGVRYWLSMWFGVVVLIGVLNALHRYLNDVSNGVASAAFGPHLIEEMTGSLSFGVLVPLLIAAFRRIRTMSGRWRHLACHALLLCLVSVLHTSLMWGSRIALFGLFGYGDYDYGRMSWRYLMEFPSDVFYYLLLAFVLWLGDRYRQAQQRELRAVQLESALSEARLDALRLQLNPHFLFNTLNAVSSIMYERPRVADEMLARIGELLRATLGTRGQEHALADERKLLELYLDIQRARFGDGLTVRIETEPSLGAARVPCLVLQPIVENAIEHGGVDAVRYVEVKAERCDRRLELSVRDGGRGEGASTHRGHGIGLSNIEARLKHLYGDAAGLRLERRDGQGTCVSLWLPYAEDRTP